MGRPDGRQCAWTPSPALGVTLLGLSLIVLAPLATLLATSLHGSPGAFLAAVTTPRVVAALKLSFFLSLVAALVSALLGLLLGWVFVRYRFCLLYTSDAADERSSVDLGGRRIIKKKNMCT